MGVTKVMTEWLTSNNSMDLGVREVVGFFSKWQIWRSDPSETRNVAGLTLCSLSGHAFPEARLETCFLSLWF